MGETGRLRIHPPLPAPEHGGHRELASHVSGMARMPCRAPPYHITTISKSSAIVRRHPAALMCFADGLRIAPEQPKYNLDAKNVHNFDGIVDKVHATVVRCIAVRPHASFARRYYGNADKQASQGGRRVFGECGSRYRVMKSSYASTVLNKLRSETSAPWPRRRVNMTFRQAQLCLPQAVSGSMGA